MKTATLLAFYGLLALSVPVARGQTGASPGQSEASSEHNPLGVTGVVTHLDRDNKALILVAPTSELTEVAKLGRTVYIDKDTHLIAIRARVDEAAPILRDGKPAHLGDIKVGDFLRTTYDPNRPVFEGIIAVSRQQIGKDADKAQKELGEESKALP